MAYLIGIAGGTGAGKSTIVRGLLDRIGGRVLDLDSYYLCRSELTANERQRVNYDEPGAIDAALLEAHLASLARDEPVEKPVYSFATHTRVGVEVVTAARLVVVEGLFTLWWEAIRALLDVKVFVDAPADLRLMRRIRRDVAERGRTVDEVLRQYVATVRPMHERYVEPLRAHANVVVVNDGLAAEAVEQIMAALRHLLVNGKLPSLPAGPPHTSAAGT